MYSSSVFLKLSGELHSLTALGRLLNSLGPIDVKKLYLRVLILLLRAFSFGTIHWGPVLSGWLHEVHPSVSLLICHQYP